MNKIILTLAEDATITKTYAPHIANNFVNLIEIVAPISKIKTQSGTVNFPGSLTVKLCVAVGGNTVVEQTLTWSGTAPYIASVPVSPALCAVNDVKVYLNVADSSTNEVPLRFDASPVGCKTVKALIASGQTVALEDNTDYSGSDINSVTFTYPQGDFECYITLAFASSGSISVVFPTSAYIGETPTFANGEKWEISVKNGVIVAGKVV